MKSKFFKALTAFVVCLTTAFGAIACGEESVESQVSGGVQPLSVAELGEGFDAKYLPDMASISARQLSGKIDVCLDFEGTQAGWTALAKEYERLHDGSVSVKVNTTYAGSTYSDKLNSELTSQKTDWDIVEGNLG